ncbi:unnamed protein product [Phytophthora lilii]|uniref:Unnamed protein product n=1 Tax=Phytophthora lilii TaxID=2077276 RepID=A0A9W6XN06_9STRA|nr:unnamed protein product [Phytophthora lilii]
MLQLTSTLALIVAIPCITGAESTNWTFWNDDDGSTSSSSSISADTASSRHSTAFTTAPTTELATPPPLVSIDTANLLKKHVVLSRGPCPGHLPEQLRPERGHQHVLDGMSDGVPRGVRHGMHPTKQRLRTRGGQQDLSVGDGRLRHRHVRSVWRAHEPGQEVDLGCQVHEPGSARHEGYHPICSQR